MQISIQHITNVGKRENNEDHVLALPEHGLFIVCDGVGGNNKGEIASSIACETISNYILNTKQKDSITSEINAAVEQTENALAEYISNSPESQGMATTLSFLHLANNTATIAHIGDSRVYHIRDGKILFQTQDHSLVNELLASGFIKPEEAKTHPKKNVITRAIQANGEHTSPEIKLLNNIQPNDYFLLCTDGVLEGIDNAFIENNFLADSSLNDLCVQIQEMCSIYSNDNYSGIFIKVISLVDESNGKKKKAWFNIFNF